MNTKLNHKLFSLSLIILTISLMLSSIAFAGGSFLGNEQYYSVSLDEEGDAIVLAKLNFQNQDNDSFNKITLEVPGHINLINAVQEVEEKIYNDNYWNGYYTENHYYTIDFEIEELSESTLVTFEFPNEVAEQEEGTILLYYKTPSLAEENWGLYNFEFTTIKNEYDTYYVRVSTTAVNNLVMDDVNDEVDYLSGVAEPAMALKMEDSADYIVSDELESASRNIEYAYGFVREAYGLDPNESFTISGKYAVSSFRLHLVRNIILIALSVLALFGIIFAINKYFKSVSFKKKNTSKYLEMSFAGLVSGVLVTAVLGFGAYALSNLYNWIGWQNRSVISLLIGILMFVFSLAGLTLPGIALWKRHKDLLIGLGTCAVTIGVMTILTILIIIFMLIL